MRRTLARCAAPARGRARAAAARAAREHARAGRRAARPRGARGAAGRRGLNRTTQHPQPERNIRLCPGGSCRRWRSPPRSCSPRARSRTPTSAPRSCSRGRRQMFTLAVPTEKEGVTTTQIELTPPAGFAIDAFVAAPGWKRTTDQTGSGEDVVIRKATWTGGDVPTGEAAVFQFVGDVGEAQDLRLQGPPDLLRRHRRRLDRRRGLRARRRRAIEAKTIARRRRQPTLAIDRLRDRDARARRSARSRCC